MTLVQQGSNVAGFADFADPALAIGGQIEASLNGAVLSGVMTSAMSTTSFSATVTAPGTGDITHSINGTYLVTSGPRAGELGIYSLAGLINPIDVEPDRRTSTLAPGECS